MTTNISTLDNNTDELIFNYEMVLKDGYVNNPFYIEKCVDTLSIKKLYILCLNNKVESIGNDIYDKYILKDVFESYDTKFVLIEGNKRMIKNRNHLKQ